MKTEEDMTKNTSEGTKIKLGNNVSHLSSSPSIEGKCDNGFHGTAEQPSFQVWACLGPSYDLLSPWKVSKKARWK